ncbi:MAG: CIA30 family protein [Woeseiaceae bacterium]
MSLLFGILLMIQLGSQIDVPYAQSGGHTVLTDLTALSSDLSWYVVDDSVMGGRSQGALEMEQGALRFAGRTITNGGGFSSIRSQPMHLDLGNRTGIQLRIRGDGRRYTWRLTTAARWRGRQVSYWADFDTRDGVWSLVNIPFARFVPQYRGYRLDGPTLDPREITGMGLMIYDKQDGPFELRLSDVGTYSLDEVFTLERYQWNNRVLVISARSDDDENLVAQKKALTQSAAEFADRDMVLVTLLDKAISLAGDRNLTTAEVATTRETLGISDGTFALRLIGKDGSVKLSRNSATSVAEIYSLIDSMPMRQREKQHP